MKITIICDKLGSAIHRLALPIQKYNPHLNIQICDLHPKRPSEEQMRRVLKNIQDSDIVDVHYWKSGELIKDEIKDKKKILFHFNPYDLRRQEWNYDEVIVGNQEMVSMLPKAYLIPYGVDLDFFEFNESYTEDKTVLMVANRIESSKGILEVAQACKELGYKFVLVGNISDQAYFDEIVKQDCEFNQNVTNEELRNIYYKSAILVCNSKDGFESGPLPILEAMSCGVPILSRVVGLVQDIYDGDNLMINEGEKENIEVLKNKLKELIENRDLRVKYRNKAWVTVKTRYDRKMARDISSLYYKMIGKPFLSVIVPTFDRPNIILECLNSVINQTYPYKEIVVVDSGDTKVEELVNKVRTTTSVPIKYIYFENKGEFTLPKARNLAVLEAQGEFLVFCDERLRMEVNALSEFAKRVSFKTWAYGIKDDYKKGFVENFSCISKKDLVLHGMFNERIDNYGGASQELRQRFGMNGYLFESVPTARAYEITKSSAKHRKKQDVVRSKFNIYKMYG